MTITRTNNRDRRNNEEIIKALKGIVRSAVDEAVDRKVPEVMGKVVNGKIDDLHIKFDDYVKGDIKWKEKVDPILGSIEELKTVGDGVKAFKFFGGGAKWIAGVGLALASIIGFLKYIK